MRPGIKTEAGSVGSKGNNLHEIYEVVPKLDCWLARGSFAVSSNLCPWSSRWDYATVHAEGLFVPR